MGSAMCSLVWCVITFSLALLAFGVPRGSHHSTHMSVFRGVFYTCVVCHHVCTGIPGSRVPSGLCHYTNTRNVTPVLCVATFSLSSLALGFLMFVPYTNTRNVAPVLCVPTFSLASLAHTVNKCTRWGGYVVRTMFFTYSQLQLMCYYNMCTCWQLI